MTIKEIGRKNKFSRGISQSEVSVNGIDINWTPQELNSFLMDRYEFGLHPFALILAFHFEVGDFGKGKKFSLIQQDSDERRKLTNLKRKIIDVICDIENQMGWSSWKELSALLENYKLIKLGLNCWG